MALSGAAHYRTEVAINASLGLHVDNTMHCWVRSSVAPSNADGAMAMYFVGNSGESPQDGHHWNHGSASYHKSRSHHNGTGGTYPQAQLTSTPATNTWHAWTSTLSGGTNLKVYFNGTLEDTDTGCAPGATRDVSYVDILGASLSDGTMPSTNDFTNGQVAEVALWNVALTQDEITALAKGFRPKIIRPGSLIMYAPCVRSLVEMRRGMTLVKKTGTETVTDHPRVFG